MGEGAAVGSVVLRRQRAPPEAACCQEEGSAKPTAPNARLRMWQVAYSWGGGQVRENRDAGAAGRAAEVAGAGQLVAVAEVL